MAAERVGGIIQVQANGVLYDAAGEFTHNLGEPKREAMTGPSGVQGYKETIQVPFIEGTIRDRSALDRRALVTMTGATVTLALPNGKVFVLRDAWYAGDGTGNTDEGTLDFRFEGMSGDEVSA